MERPAQTIFYSLEKAIKSYRQFAQRNLADNGFSVTIDQGLILSLIQDNPGITQQQIAVRAFKDHASVTRIIENLVSRDFLKRDFHRDDRRRFELSVTASGTETLLQMEKTVVGNRTKALEGISAYEIETLKNLLERITQNCK
ncbi:winged helix-turn-helix transcriptional regulator [Flavobacterium sp. MAH-1]|uniref:Winged helix-turn-helix transcriptional regulator n=1 Tax=Flavobacterium agri TaxID=2743471 RepID=A0A7Y9C5Y8_9FLAO|nr:MarR family winged helix-turn-helix transcriptional regulator [Flavobacterium agri]NUY79833.1 winged helix-turn-helix transcriptional regulator [Flavobacterium agri]NYA69858.1 winged helix-turn-helix transcriptional regulator [Flavobacterium agri]